MDWSYGTSTWAPPAKEEPRENYVERDAPVLVENEQLGVEGAAVLVANSGSGGVCVDEEAVQREAAEYANACHRAIQNGKTIEDVTAIGANLSESAKQEIYAQAAIQQGTSAEAVAANAEKERQQAMDAIEAGMVGIAALATATNIPQQETRLPDGITYDGNASLSLLCTLSSPNVPDCRAPGLAQGFVLS